MSAKDDDLYVDLDDLLDKKEEESDKKPPPKKQKTAQNEEAPKPPPRYDSPIKEKDAEATIEALKKQLVAVQKENNILKRNTGILYRTAMNEIERKDNRIESLERELDLLRPS